MVPTPYASLIEFITLLNAGNDAAARAWVTEASLIETARSFGLHDAPGQNWLPTCDQPSQCGVSAPLRFFEGSGPAVAISFVQQDGRWLISAIAPAVNEPFPN
jgi:hypothetical protein